LLFELNGRSDGIGRAAAKLALIVDRRAARAQIDPGRQFRQDLGGRGVE